MWSFLASGKTVRATTVSELLQPVLEPSTQKPGGKAEDGMTDAKRETVKLGCEH